MTLYSVTNRALALPLILFVVTALAPSPFACRMQYHIDSVQYPLALDYYDIGLNKPHLPGYFVYIRMKRLIHWTVADSTRHSQPLAFLLQSVLLMSCTGCRKAILLPETSCV